MDTWLLITFWLMTGTFIGGVVTPVLAARKRINPWGVMAFGVLVGAIGHIVLLIPLWAALARLPNRTTTGPAWREDTVSLEALTAAVEMQPAPSEQLESVLALLRENFWPAPRGHSHRMAYVQVFVALAIITAVEVLISMWDGAPFNVVVPLVALSSAKVLLVVLFFMHLRYDHPWYSWIFASALPFAAIVMVVLAVA